MGANGVEYTAQFVDRLISQTIDGVKTFILAPLFPVFVHAGVSLTLGTAKVYVFSGTNTTWSLPVGTLALIGTHYELKNRGSGTITLNVLDASATIYDTAAVTSISILAGEKLGIVWDGTFWVVI